MANNKFLQLFRSSNVYNSKVEAISELKGAFGEHKKDGEPIIARYWTSADKVAVKTLLGISYFSGAEGAVVHDTIIDVDAASEELQAAINALIDGASDGYKTLGDLEDKIKAEAERATAAENGLQGAIDVINGNETTDGSIKKSLADAKDYTDTQVSVEKSRAEGAESGLQTSINNLDTAYKAADSAINDKIGTVADGKTVVEMIEDAQKAAIASGTVVELADGTDKITLNESTADDGHVTYTIGQNDIASAQGLADEIAARKAIDGQNGQTYTANANANYIKDATSLNDADVKLDAQVKANADAIAKEVSDRETAIAAEKSRAEGQEAAIRTEFATADTTLKNELLGDAADDYNTLGKLEDEIQKVASDAKTYEIVAVTENLGTNVKEAWKLVDEDGNQAGATINIYKDSTLKEVKLEGQVLQFTYILADGTESTVGVDVSKFLAETEFKDGLAVSNNGEVSVKIDETSESFLTVSTSGVKISGVQDAIDDAIDSLNNNEDTAVDGQYIAAIVETNGIVNVKTRANVSDAVLTGYAKGTDKSAVSSTDDVKGAIAKLENQIADAKSSASQSVADLDAEITSTNGTNVNVKVTQVDGKITAVNVTESDIASAQGLANEIAAREAADEEINNKINAMDLTDAVNNGEYVYSVNQTDGKITVEHKVLIAASADGNANDMLDVINGSIVLSNVFDMGTY